MKDLRNIRLLPTLAAALLVFAVLRTTGLVRSLAGEPAHAESTHGAAVPKPTAGHAPQPAAPAPAVVAAPAVPVLPPPPPEVTEAERSLLQELRGRRTEIEAKEKALAAREALLSATEHRLSSRVEELQSLQSRLEGLDTVRREKEEANWRSLVRTYETMRPRDAAAIMNDLDPAVMVPVLDRMKEAKTAAILAAMQPDRARTATMLLAQQRAKQVQDSPESPKKPPQG
jgi:flagellar motility protein MotE (MotC chaperone)